MHPYFLVSFILLIATGSARAASGFAGEFLALGAGARSVALGSAYVALANDPTATYWNPAGLTRLDKKQLHLMHAERFSGLVNHDFVAIARPGRRLHGLGIALLRVGVDDIQFTELQDSGRALSGDNRPLVSTTESSADYALYLSAAHRLRDKVSMGLSLKLIYRQIATFSAYGIGLDLGAYYQLSPAIRLAANLRDITTTPIYWDTETTDRINPSLLVGAAYDLPLAGGHVTLAIAARTGGDANDADDASPFNAGVEYNYRTLALRGGLEEGRQAFGMGLQPHQRIALDVAYMQHDELESTYQFSANLSF
ncbi:MAG: hypothetical protein ACI906_003859 [Candidatus Latescibacterota bacterium]|jgi:hypothetical protein